MKIKANRQNLKKHARDLLGPLYSPERERELIEVCAKTEKDFADYGSGHPSHARAEHLAEIDRVLGTHGVEGMLLDSAGQDVAGYCDESLVAHDIQYCNAGDTYALTIMYYNGTLCIGDWGSILERCL